jgi:hypothetical protein
VFLRLYVPHGRYQSEQLEDFLTLFTRYLRDVEGKEFSIDVQRTGRGSTYVFRGRGEAGSMEELRDATRRFDNFLVLAETDGRAAEELIVQAGAAAGEARATNLSAEVFCSLRLWSPTFSNLEPLLGRMAVLNHRPRPCYRLRAIRAP